MTDYNYDFPDKSYAGLVDTFENTQYGQKFSFFLGENFTSISQAIHHTQPVDGSSVVHLLTGDTMTFEGVPKRRFAAVARTVGTYFGFNP